MAQHNSINFCDTLNEWCTIFEYTFSWKITPYNSDITSYENVSITIITNVLVLLHYT